jgi:hypothetical protein
MAHGLNYKHEEHTTAVNLINTQLEKIDLQTHFTREQDRLEIIRYCMQNMWRPAMARF